MSKLVKKAFLGIKTKKLRLKEQSDMNFLLRLAYGDSFDKINPELRKELWKLYKKNEGIRADLDNKAFRGMAKAIESDLPSPNIPMFSGVNSPKKDYKAIIEIGSPEQGLATYENGVIANVRGTAEELAKIANEYLGEPRAGVGIVPIQTQIKRTVKVDPLQLFEPMLKKARLEKDKRLKEMQLTATQRFKLETAERNKYYNMAVENADLFGGLMFNTMAGALAMPAMFSMAPINLAGGLAGGVVGANSFDSGIKAITNNKVDGWQGVLENMGLFDHTVDDYTTQHLKGTVSEMTNPGAIAGGMIGSAGANFFRLNWVPISFNRTHGPVWIKPKATPAQINGLSGAYMKHYGVKLTEPLPFPKGYKGYTVVNQNGVEYPVLTDLGGGVVRNPVTGLFETGPLIRGALMNTKFDILSGNPFIGVVPGTILNNE